MEMRPFERVRSAARDLSKAPPFRVGPLAVDPALRRLVAGGRAVVLQPRVMRVLVALAEREGEVLSRDDLIECCWDGIIVGDNAINRVISQLRRALADLTGEAVRLETITKVGFRLVHGTTFEVCGEQPPPVAAPGPLGDPAPSPARAPVAAPPPAARPGGLSRRQLAWGAGGAAALVAGGGFLAFLSGRARQPDPRAVALADKAETLLKSGLPGSINQAVQLLQEATAIDPEYADGWGRLAGMYRHMFQDFGEGEKRSYPGLVRSAASRALALDPRQPDARLALALLTPWMNNWAAAERVLIEVQREFPRHWYANGQLSLLMMDVGRLEDGLRYRRNLMDVDPEIPHSWAFLAVNLVMAGRIHEADRALDSAADKWPRQPFLWFTRRAVLIETERPREAVSFVRDVRYQPEGIPPRLIEMLAEEAEAIDSDDPARRGRAVDTLLASIEAPQQFTRAAPVLARLGAGDLALGAMFATLFGGRFAGRDWPAPSPYEYRPIGIMHYPSMRALQGLPAYQAIIERAGLKAYWAETGRSPDRIA